VYLVACASTPNAIHAEADPYEAELAAVRYSLHSLSAGEVKAEPVEVETEEFRRALRMLAPGLPFSAQPMETARLLMARALEGHVLAEVERGRVVRMTPLEEGSPLDVASAEELKRKYLGLCDSEYGGGDCLGLLADGPVLQREDLRTLALAIALGGVLRETRHALKELVQPQAVVALVVCTVALYFGLWLLPEPVSKGLAASLTLALIAWLGVDTVWSLMDGWARLAWEADRATSFEQLRAAGERYGKVMGGSVAKVLVMLVTAALTGTAARFTQKLPKLPGFQRASVQAEAQGGGRLTAAADVEAAAAQGEGTFTLMVRSPGSRGANAADEAQAGLATIIRHHGGNRQVFINGQRWHVPANRSIKEIPAKDPVGDQLQAAAERAARKWSPNELTDAERAAIREARKQGKHLKAHLMERRFRGRWVENELRPAFKHLRWSGRGVDAMDPATGYRYEVLSGTVSNMELHGRRMAQEFFRLITF
jgi:hypothetical protein